VPRASSSPCLCGDPECRRCFPVAYHPLDTQTELTQINLKTEPGERVLFLFTEVNGDVAIRADGGATLDDLELLERFFPALLASLRQRFTRRM